MNESLTTSKSVDEYSKDISSAAARSIDCFIEVGMIITDAKSNLHNGEFGLLFESGSPHYVGMSRTNAYNFMSISNNAQKAIDYKSSLPLDVTQIAKIVKMDSGEIERSIAANIIRPDMKRNDLSPKREQQMKTVDIDHEQVYPSPQFVDDNIIETLATAIDTIIDHMPVDKRKKFLQRISEKWNISASFN